MALPVSLTDSPSDIFKLFRFLQAVERFVDDSREPGSVGEESVTVDESEKREDASTVAMSDGGAEEIPLEQEAAAEEQVAVDEQATMTCLKLLSLELIPDEELFRLPPDSTKDVFPYFMRANFQMPDVDETPLGCFLSKKKEEQIEDLTAYELEQMLSFTLKENKMLNIQNDVFRSFLKKNDPRYNDGNSSTCEAPSPDDQVEDTPLDISTAEMVRSKVIFPDVEGSDSEKTYRAVLNLYTRVVEHEVKSVYKEYEIELNKFNAKMRDLSSTKNALSIHRDKIRETATLLKVMIVKKQLKKKKFIFDAQQFAEFLRAAIKQDQQDLRRFRVMLYEHKRKFASIQRKIKSSEAVHRVDLELYEIKAKQLCDKLTETNEEFLQLKKIFDSYQKRLDKFQKRLEVNRKMLSQNQKTYLKKVRDLEVQHVCYKMAFESISELMTFIVRLYDSVKQRENDVSLRSLEEKKDD